MSTESKEFDPYEAVLADLLSKKDQIDKAIQAIELVRGSSYVSASSAGTQTSYADAPGAFLGMSIAEATKKLLLSTRKQMNNAEILAALKKGGMVMNSADPINTLGAVLTRRYKENGDIVRVDRGTWGLKEWYPGRSFGKTLKNNGDTEVKASSSEPEQP
ncbi:MAG: winged helix-turn-helix domain-containing protein [Alphaproteobacteria bacterium]|nr:winged helix-turn-helix domain-containing protein [Alphaproteobacteria bacterium]